MARRGVLSGGLALFLLLASALAPGVAAAEGELTGEPAGFKAQRELSSLSLDLLRPFKNVLSGPVWLVANGINPLRSDLSGAERRLYLGGPRLSGVGAPLAQGGAGALVPYRDPTAKFSRNILIPRDFSQAPLQTEPIIAVNPKDPNHLIAGMIDYNFPAVTAYVSIDGGVTWEGPFQMKYPREELAAAGDPILAFDQNGTAYMGFISLDVEEFRLGSIIGEATVSSISVSVSTDGGYTWSSAVPSSRSKVIVSPGVPGDGPARGEFSFEFLDKPWLAVGRNPKDPKKDIIYVTYTKFISRYGLGYAGELPFLTSPVLETVIELVKSENGGITWSVPVEVSPRVRQTFGGSSEKEAPERSPDVVDSALVRSLMEEGGLVGDLVLAPQAQAEGGTKRVVQGSQPEVAPDGTVYVAWLDSTDDGPFEGLAQIAFARSDDGGKTFTRGRAVSTFLEPGFSPRTTFFRSWGSAFPQIALGPQGEVYIAYVALPSGDPGDDGNLFVVRSLDRGQRWDRPVRVNDDQTSRLQFFPAIAVGPDGKVHAMWGDMRDDPQDIRYHIYYAVSEDQGKTFGLNARVTDSYSNPNYGFPGGQFIGDYFAITATQDEVYMVWADTRLGEFVGTNQKIGFARKRQMPNPSIFLSPARGAGGRDVTIQGFNYQPNQNLYVQVGGVIVSTERTNAQGGFTTRLFIPIAGEGAHTVAVLDTSGNAAAASFFMDFGFDNIRKTAEQVAVLTGRIPAIEAKLAEPPRAPAEVTADLASIKSAVTDLKAVVAEFKDAQAAAAAEAQSQDQRVLLVAIFAAVAASLAVVAAGLAAVLAGRRRSRAGA